MTAVRLAVAIAFAGIACFVVAANIALGDSSTDRFFETPDPIEGGWFGQEPPRVHGDGDPSFSGLSGEPIEVQRPDPARLDEIWRWAVAFYHEHTGNVVENPRPPVIVYGDRYTLQRYAFGDEGYWILRDRIQEDVEVEGETNQKIAGGRGASYDNGTVTLRLDTDYSRLTYEFVIAHEFYHHMQFLAGEFEDVSCNATLEIDAYAAQNAWVDETGFGQNAPDRHVFQILQACGS